MSSTNRDKETKRPVPPPPPPPVEPPKEDEKPPQRPPAAIPTVPGDGLTATEARDETLAINREAGATIAVDASDAPNSPQAAAEADVVALSDEIEELRAALAAAQAELAAAKSGPAGLVEVELETGAPTWVQAVSGLAREEIAGWTVLPGNVLVVKDTAGREGHRFTIPEVYRRQAGV